jgi:protease-4
MTTDNENQAVDSFTEKYVKRFYKVHVMKTIFIGAAVLFIIFNAASSYLGKLYPEDHIAIINIAGTIATGNPEGSGLKISEALSRAFKSKNAKAILLVMNSGGGSPVQAEMTYDTINSLRSEYDKPIIVSMADVCASACYFIASASDHIYAHRSTITGSIGVRMDTWGLKKVIDFVGIERRTITTGPFKSILDPFQDMKESDKDIVRNNALEPMFVVFKDSVRKGRGAKITLKDEDIFNGLFWAGEQAIELGLVDSIKATPIVIQEMQKEYGVDAIHRYNGRRFSVAQMLTSSLESVINTFNNDMESPKFY